MYEVFNILDEDTLSNTKVALAKPDKTIFEHTTELLEALDTILSLGYISKGRLYDLVQKAILYHDIGKVNNEFQNRIIKKNGRFNKEIEVVHNVLSLYFIDKDCFDNLDDYIKVAHAVCNHHYYCNNYDELRSKEEQIKSLLLGFNTQTVKRRVKSLLATIVEDNEAIKIKGYLHKCDYAASSNLIVEYKNDFLLESMNNLLNKWKKNNKLANWNMLQKFCMENSNDNIIAIAQTGMGKTEGGLLWIGDNKGFFILPIRTAINSIYSRVCKEILSNKSIDTRVSILHSSALEYYLKNVANENEDLDIRNYYKVGKQLSIPLNIATMDALFDFVFKYPSYELKLTTLSYSKIVIDEIQAYGPDLLAYLIYGLEKVVELGGKVAILTATLPPFIKDMLSKKIKFKESNHPFINDIARHNIKVLNKRICYEDIKVKYLKNKQDKVANKVLVVCNTIKEAQRLYEELKSDPDIDNSELDILHSKFIRKDRMERENKILSFGNTYNNQGEIDIRNCIYISTSIVEASLDIDFDYLFTELQDLNSLFQRLGRCNRKGVKSVDKYNCYIYLEIEEGNFINGNRGFIDRTLFELSKKAIINWDGILTEENKIQLIDKYLTYELLEKSDYIRTYNKVYDYISTIPPYKFDVKEVDLRNILSEDIIPGPIYEKYFEKIKNIERNLLDYNNDNFEVIKLKDEIRDYTVSVNLIDIKNYERAIKGGNAINYNRISLSRYKNDYIRVIDCDYDDSGYKKKRFDGDVKHSVIF